MKRACFKLRIKKNKIDEYLERHHVWPEMLEALSNAGIKNYSLFVDRDENCIIGYFESENPEESLRKVGQTDVNRRWQEGMMKYFENGSGDLKKGGIQWLKSYFFLE